ncbi:hypothetical protein PJL18_03936 [Paenarthrobacter nicotinovorans]|nr:hypothetical protein [Paenarthrobacter nicotinovorans]
MGVVFEVAACGLAGVGEAEAVCSEGGEVVGDELSDLVGDGFHVVGDCDDGSGVAVELFGDEGCAGGLAGVEEGVFFGVESVASEFVPGGHGPDGRGDSPVVVEDFLGFEGPGDGHAGGEDVRGGAVSVSGGGLGGVGELVDAFEEPVGVEVFGFGGLGDGLVVDGEVVHDVLIVTGLAVHLFEAVADDVADFVAVGGVVGADGGVGGGQDGGVPVGVLESFAGEGGSSCGRADDEAAGHLVRGGPEGISGALEAEHGVEHVDRDQGFAVGGVGGAGGGECCDGAGFVDAGVDQLACG